MRLLRAAVFQGQAIHRLHWGRPKHARRAATHKDERLIGCQSFYPFCIKARRLFPLASFFGDDETDDHLRREEEQKGLIFDWKASFWY